MAARVMSISQESCTALCLSHLLTPTSLRRSGWTMNWGPLYGPTERTSILSFCTATSSRPRVSRIADLPAAISGRARRSLARGPRRPPRVARDRPAHHLQVQQRALAAGGGDRDAEQVDHPVAAEVAGLVERHPLQLLGGDRGGRLGDRAAVAVEAQVGDVAVADLDVHAKLVAAERVLLEGLQVVGGKLAEVVRALVVLEDVLAV